MMNLLIWFPIYMEMKFHISEVTISVMILTLSIGTLLGFFIKLMLQAYNKEALAVVCNICGICQFNLLLVLTIYEDIL